MSGGLKVKREATQRKKKREERERILMQLRFY